MNNVDLNINYNGPEPKNNKQWGIFGVVAIVGAALACAGGAAKVGLDVIMKILESNEGTQSSPNINPAQKS